MKKQVLITQAIPDSAVELLGQYFDVIYRNETTPISEYELIKTGNNCFGIISFLSDNLNRNIIDQLHSVRIIANYAVGYNNIDMAAATEKGISVSNTPDVLTHATADLTLALLLAVGRRIVEADKYCRSGHFTGWQSKLLLGFEFHGKKCGVIGFGRIGQAFANRAASLGLEVSYYSRTKQIDSKYSYLELDHLLEQSDVISLHLPLTPATVGLLDKEKLSKLKFGSIIINTGRGELIDETYLYKLLESGKLFGAGLDVFEREPEIFEGLKKLPNTVLTPHIGSATVDTRNRMALLAAESVIAELLGRPYSNKVN